MLDALPLHLVDRMCLFLRDIRDASALQKTCNRLRWAGLGPECKWHWRLNVAQSMGLSRSKIRRRVLSAGTAIGKVEIYKTAALVDSQLFHNVQTVDAFLLVHPHSQLGLVLTRNSGELKRMHALGITREEGHVVYKIGEKVAARIISCARDAGLMIL